MTGRRRTFQVLVQDMIAPIVSRNTSMKTKPRIQKLSFENRPLRTYQSTSSSSTINSKRPAHEDASEMLGSMVETVLILQIDYKGLNDSPYETVRHKHRPRHGILTEIQAVDVSVVIGRYAQGC